MEGGASGPGLFTSTVYASRIYIERDKFRMKTVYFSCLFTINLAEKSVTKRTVITVALLHVVMDCTLLSSFF